MEIGAGLWCMRATAQGPGHPALYRELVQDARLVEELGLPSLWLSEHHGWYDGWCPSLLVAGAAVLGATQRLSVGTGVFLLPLHDPARVAAAGVTLQGLAPGRTDLGIGLGYREAELDAVGVSRRARGRIADAALGGLQSAWAAGGPRMWIGGLADRSLSRAGRHGLGLFLPSTMTARRLGEVVSRAQEAAAAHGRSPGPVAVLKHAWITDGGPRAERAARAAIARDVGEYGGSWWELRGRRGFDAPELLEEQMARSAQSAAIGTPEAVAEQLRELAALGADLVVVQLAHPRSRPAYRENLRRLAAEVVPQLL
jgi:alkanesulfonate monooxygenase SsuD/methylene tetrahydromethanopterin reductase-like flavin-dependent oxidoreductase (luciferase family)